MRYVKFLRVGEDHIEVAVREFVDKTAALLISCTSTSNGFLILYEVAENMEDVMDQEVSETPTVAAYITEAGKKKTIRVMAGIFPVPVGAKMHPDDEEAAPLVLLAKDVDLSRYAGVGGFR